MTPKSKFYLYGRKDVTFKHSKDDGTQQSKVKNFVIISHTMGLSNYYHVQTSQTTEFYGYQLTNKTERRAKNNNR